MVFKISRVQILVVYKSKNNKQYSLDLLYLEW